MENKEWKGLDEIIAKYISSEKYLSFDEKRTEALAQLLAPKMQGESLPPAFWQLNDYKINGKNIFPPVNGRDTMQFCLVAVAQFFSYWYKDGTQEQVNGVNRDVVKNWGVMVNGEFVDDTIAVIYCLYQSIDHGINILDAKRLTEISAQDVDKIYNYENSSIAFMPMQEERKKKFNEIGEGLLKFAADYSTEPHFIGMLKLCNGDISKIIGFMQKYFPYSYGDKFAKLVLLCVKILWDKTSENLSKHNIPAIQEDGYDELLNISGFHLFDAMADYMVPLFLIRTGVVRVNDENFFNALTENREITHLPEIEDSYRAFTLEAVRRIAVRIAEINKVSDTNGKYRGWLRFVLDSVFWANALFMCKGHTYDNAAADKCPFAAVCQAVCSEKLMLTGFPLVRTTNY